MRKAYRTIFHNAKSLEAKGHSSKALAQEVYTYATNKCLPLKKKLPSSQNMNKSHYANQLVKLQFEFIIKEKKI